MRDWFKEYKSIDGEEVLIGNNIACQMIGVGNISIKMFNGSSKILSGVRHAPNLRGNLISIGSLDESSFVNKFEDRSIKINIGALVVMKGIKNNGFYINSSREDYYRLSCYRHS